jgi:alpha-L-fucosidase
LAAGPSTQPQTGTEAKFNENKRKDLTAQDTRFTTKGGNLYAFVMGWPGSKAVIEPLAMGTAKVANVELLGFKGRLKWAQTQTGLEIELPEQPPCEHAIAFKIAT